MNTIPSAALRSVRLNNNREFGEAMRKVMSDSTCRVRILETQDTVQSMLIRFTGSAARFPSTSNNQKILFTGNRTKRMSVGHSQATLGRMNAARQLYIQALHGLTKNLPTFGSDRVFVQIALAKDRWIRDSHNYAKPICDWLESVHIVTNDLQIECHCFKREEYFDRINATDILIVRRVTVQTCLEAFARNIQHDATSV